MSTATAARKPLVAAIEGAALGGGLEMALVADLLVAARDATFAAPEVRHGLFPGGERAVELPRTLPDVGGEAHGPHR